MANQIEIFSPHDPIIQSIIEGSEIEYTGEFVDVTDNRTNKTYRLYPRNSEKKKLFSDPDKYMEDYFKKHPGLK